MLHLNANELFIVYKSFEKILDYYDLKHVWIFKTLLLDDLFKSTALKLMLNRRDE